MLTDDAHRYNRCSRKFQYRVEVFFQVIVLNRRLGNFKCHAIRVELQIHDSPHIHYFLRILNAPVLTKDNINEYISFVDNIVTTSLPDTHNEPKLFELVTTYQLFTFKIMPNVKE